jgi:hypothetical protein
VFGELVWSTLLGAVVDGDMSMRRMRCSITLIAPNLRGAYTPETVSAFRVSRIGSGLTLAPQPAHEHLSRSIPCPTQRSHAIGLWVARNTALSRKDPLNSAFLKGEVLHRTYALCSPAHLTLASARTWR